MFRYPQLRWYMLKAGFYFVVVVVYFYYPWISSTIILTT